MAARGRRQAEARHALPAPREGGRPERPCSGRRFDGDEGFPSKTAIEMLANLDKAKTSPLWRILVGLASVTSGRSLLARWPTTSARSTPSAQPPATSSRPSTGWAASSRTPSSPGSRSTGTARSSIAGRRPVYGSTTPGHPGRSAVASAGGSSRGLTVVATGSLEGFTREGAQEAILPPAARPSQCQQEDRLRGGGTRGPASSRRPRRWADRTRRRRLPPPAGRRPGCVDAPANLGIAGPRGHFVMDSPLGWSRWVLRP